MLEKCFFVLEGVLLKWWEDFAEDRYSSLLCACNGGSIHGDRIDLSSSRIDTDVNKNECSQTLWTGFVNENEEFRYRSKTIYERPRAG